MLLLNQQAEIQGINSHATLLLGGKQEDYLGKPIFTLVDPADRFFLREKWSGNNASAHTTRQFTVRLRKFDGPSDWYTLRVEAEDESLADPPRLVRLQHLSTTRSNI